MSCVIVATNRDPRSHARAFRVMPYSFECAASPAGLVARGWLVGVATFGRCAHVR